MKSYLKRSALKRTAESLSSVVKSNSGWKGHRGFLPAQENRLMMCCQDTCKMFLSTAHPLLLFSASLSCPCSRGMWQWSKTRAGRNGHWCDFFTADFLLPLYCAPLCDHIPEKGLASFFLSGFLLAQGLLINQNPQACKRQGVGRQQTSLKCLVCREWGSMEVSKSSFEFLRHSNHPSPTQQGRTWLLVEYLHC